MKPRAAKSGVQTLHPGDVACVDRGECLETLLGSCVAILLTDPRRTVGAMCHVVHAGPQRGAPGRDTAFGEAALAEMSRRLLARGIDARQCQAWVYGGGNMFPSHIGNAAAEGNVGAANAQWALDALQRAGVRVLGAELGGQAYRKLHWRVGAEAPQVEALPIAPQPAPSQPERKPT